MLRRLAVLLTACLLCFGGISNAQTVVLPAGDGVISEVRITGQQRIEPATILSYMAVRAGDPFDPVAIDDSLKALFDTGLFADVVLRRDGSVLIVDVRENPVINRIAFEGNLRLESAVLENEIQSRPRVVFTRTRVQNDVARVLEVYRRSGRFAATVEPKVIPLDQNRVDLVFEIDEGPLTGVESITFIGNEAFSDSRLRREILTVESAFYNLLNPNDNYDPDRLDFDRELLRRFYLSQGYADFRVVSAVAELTPDRERFFITFTIEEGPRYRFGEVDLISLLPDLDTDLIADDIVSDTGDFYSNELVDESIRNLTEAVGDLQYAFVDIRPIVRRNRDDQTISITYEINEGPRVFVERIDINGNVRTVDEVIRREIELIEGDPFNASRLRRSESQIRNLGFFSQVEVAAVPGTTPDRTVIQVDVTEQGTGEIQLFGGFSTGEGPIGGISLRERNLFGRAQDLRLTGTISGGTQEIDLSFTEPYFLDRDLSAGIDLFRITRDNQDESSFNEFAVGFGLRLGYALGEDLRQSVGYTLSAREIEDVDLGASRFILEQEGETITSAIRQQIVYNQLDSRIRPTDGYLLRFGNEIAGLGGDVQYIQTTLGGNFFYPITEGVILSVRGEAGHIIGLGQDVRINDRFFVGGRNLRGFEAAGIGPRDGNGDSLGGNIFGVGSVEMEFPLGLPEQLGIRGRAFTDVGTLTGIDDETSGTAPQDQVFDEASVRMSVGAGLSWDSPFGPVQVDMAVPVLSEDFDQEEVFRFSIGTRF